jgi:4-hydroxy-3-methylbut-2-enyl diphosphate reductase
LARHFGFCYGVENAIEIAYKAIKENPDKRIYLLSQMIHNPAVNDDLTKLGIAFLQDTDGKQLISFESLKPEDIVIIPAFGTTLEIEKKLNDIGINIQQYNTTCPFVEKVWNRSGKLGDQGHTVIIHGKASHEETRATFSQSANNAPTLIIKDMEEAVYLGKIISGDIEQANFYSFFEGKYTSNFNPEQDLARIGVVNQTTMLATETESITAYIRSVMVEKFGVENIKNHMADTRDTLCYATNDNQSSTLALMENEYDLAIVVGGYNSSNTTHLVEILESKFPTYFIKDESEIVSKNEIHSFNIHQKFVEQRPSFLPDLPHLNIAITSGASCPDSIMDEVIQRILTLCEEDKSIEEVLLAL